MSESHAGGGGGARRWSVVVVVACEEDKGWVPWSHVNGGEESFERRSQWGVGA